TDCPLSPSQSLLFLGLVAAVCLGLNLLFLTIHLICLCCCKRDQEPDSKRPRSCCITWMAVTAGLICCTAVGIGFYGNSETNDGVYQLLYALDHANHILTDMDSLVGLWGRVLPSNPLLQGHIDPLSWVWLKHWQEASGWRDPGELCLSPWGVRAALSTGGWASMALDTAAAVVSGDGTGGTGCAKAELRTPIPSFPAPTMPLSSLQGTSDFCVAPDKFIMNQTESEISAVVVHYYLYCDQSLSNPFQQALTVFQRSLTTMQIQTQGLIQFALPLFPTAEKDLLGVQQLLNSSETSLHQLTAMLDCRGLHKDYLDALIGICYDGVEGLLYLVLFSLLVAASFSTIICATPRAWKHFAGRDRDYDDMDEEDPFNPQARRIATHNPARGQLRSFCSYSSSLGSQSSLHPPAQTISNAPVSEYMNQAVLFGGNPRYENVPLIGRGSPPPTYSPSMRATYLAVTEEHGRRHSTEFPA
ncbi:TTYH2 protein, partial [Centropus unirufus]|nr:TTYH2 protein [Centropus unirufus]